MIKTRLQDDPSIFARSIDAQMNYVLVQPILELRERTTTWPLNQAIVVDGLDECGGSDYQRQEVINALESLEQAFPVPLSIIVASRPHEDIRSTFRSGPRREKVIEEPLYNDNQATADIRLFFTERLGALVSPDSDHPFKSSITLVNGHWPPLAAIEFLVEKASGQFIFAATIVRFVESRPANPDKRLKITLGFLPTGKLEPYREHDALYTGILSRLSEDVLSSTLLLLGLIGAMKNVYLLITDIALGLGSGTSKELLLELESLVDITSAVTVFGTSREVACFYHKSFLDYLFDQSRSGRFFTDQQQVCDRLYTQFLSIDTWRPG